MDFLANIVQQVLTVLYNFTESVGIPNLGLAIVLMTIIIKLIMYPLTQKQIQSTKAMMEIQPKMKALQEKYKDDKIHVIGQYLSQLEEIAKILNVPIITGKTPNVQRDLIYKNFRSGKIRVLVVSKVANFAIDLPDASIAIQISGTFGSRQEEAQRLGRILRPKERESKFFSLITRNTVEEEFGSNRQKFLAEQGYAYRIVRYSGDDNDL